MKRTLAAAAAVIAATTAGDVGAETPQVIELTQVPCQFLDVESDHGFMSKSKADCERINGETGPDRSAAMKPLNLKPGKYVFRVANKNVPYELGFWLREADYDWRNPLHKLSKTSVSGGGLATGTTKDYEVTLKPGEYLFSCPLNPTPNYAIRVSD